MSRDPIGYEFGYNLYEYLRSNPSRYLDPSGLGLFDCFTREVPYCVWSSKSKSECMRCCMGKGGRINQCRQECEQHWPKDLGLCAGEEFDRETHCCEDSKVVAKVRILVCKGRLGGDGAPVPIMGPIGHSYIVCPGGQFGMHARDFDEEGSPFIGPGYINEEIHRDPDKAHCKPKMICPAKEKEICGEGPSPNPYLVTPVPCFDNCHHWAND